MRRPRSQRLAISGLAVLGAAAALLLTGPTPAAGVVTPRFGHRATVDGFTSWYGSYGMAGLGTGWCIDHGIPAPDPAFAYRPADLGTVPIETRTAMAWVLGTHAIGTDRSRHAAVMLVLHDLMGARYPSGPLDVGRLTVDRLAGFGGHEASILAQARMLKADGLRHADLRGALTLRLSVGAVDAGGSAPVTASVRDASGRGVVGVRVALSASPGSTLAASAATTGADGRVRTVARPVRLPLTVRASAVVPRLDLDAWAPTTRVAQRVARPATVALHATAGLAAPPAPTTTTVPPTTTTVPPTTTTVPPTTVPPTTTTTSTTTTTTAPSTTTTVMPTTTTTAPVVVASTTTTIPPSPAPSLPRTGRDTTAMALLGVGSLLLGAAALDARATLVRSTRAIGHHGDHGGIGHR